MLGFVITAICVPAIAAAVWFSPARTFVLDTVSGFGRTKFTCKVSLQSDENASLHDRDNLCFEMTGCIPTPCDHFDTDIRLDIEDITAGLSKSDPVLSVDPDYRHNKETEFSFHTHNGQVPQKNAVLSHWVTVATIPCSVLRFAYRGRRKLLCKLSVLSAETGDVLAADQQVIEYVSRSEGYRQIQQRKLDLLTSSIQLAVITSSPNSAGPACEPVIHQWLEETGQHFSAATQLKNSLAEIYSQAETLSLEQAAEPLLAFGDLSDRTAALELTLKIFVHHKKISAANGQALIELASLLDIKPELFLVLCQQYFLQEGCRIENPSFMLGVNPAMKESIFRARLNDEYRKWNARVTHPNKNIRHQADRMLTLIAELRSTHQICS